MQRVLPDAIMKKVINELYQNGMDFNAMAKLLKCSVMDIVPLLPDKLEPPYVNPNPLNQQLIDEILYDANVPIAKDAIVRIEKTRYQHYAELEESCLRIMNNLLKHYESIPEGDSKIDQFKAQLASNFIKATQSAREEILKKYEIDSSRAKQDTITVEVVNPLETHVTHASISVDKLNDKN